MKEPGATWMQETSQAKGERRLTRTWRIWILCAPLINQPTAHLDQSYALSGTYVIGDEAVAALLGGVCV